MTTLSDKRVTRSYRATNIALAATASMDYFQGGLACLDTSTGLVDKGQASTTLVPIGKFAKSGSVPAGGGEVVVELFREIHGEWFVNSGGGDEVVAADVGGLAYVVDDQTVANNDGTGTRSAAGRIWKIDSNKGVLVEPLTPAST